MSQGKSGRKAHKKPAPKQGASDSAIYIGFAMTGIVIAFLAALLTGGRYWREIVLGYVLALAWLVNLYGWRAYFGQELSGWQQAFARIPLRAAGYGTRGGKPLEAAHGRPPAKRALLATSIVSLVVLALLATVLAPGMGTA
ncbi:MAG: hypothetical protein ACYTGR_09845 [Planctomycetota bacterium]|jgi:hypothetical protein